MCSAFKHISSRLKASKSQILRISFSLYDSEERLLAVKVRQKVCAKCDGVNRRSNFLLIYSRIDKDICQRVEVQS